MQQQSRRDNLTAAIVFLGNSHEVAPLERPRLFSWMSRTAPTATATAAAAATAVATAVAAAEGPATTAAAAESDSCSSSPAATGEELASGTFDPAGTTVELKSSE
jgi:hypothetical protein